MEQFSNLLVSIPFLCLAILGVVWITMRFCLQTATEYAQMENSDFRVLVDQYRKIIDEATTADSMAKKNDERTLQIIEAINLNTKSLSMVESALNQLVLRQVGFNDRTSERQRMVGEEMPPTRVGNRLVVRPTPTTRTPAGAEGFVDETSGEVKPLEERTPRDLAATELT